MENLLSTYFSKKPELSSKSKETYINNLTRLYGLLNLQGSKDITKVGQKKIIEAIKNSGYDPISLSRIYLGVYYAKNNKTPTIVKKWVDKFKTIKQEQQPSQNDTITSKYSYQDLIDMLNKMNGTEYMMFYILINFNTRNQDLVVQFKQPSKDDKGNCIYINKGKAIYVRRDFKTHKSYGDITHQITDDKFLKALNNINKDAFLFGTNESAVRKRITRTAEKYGINGINQQTIYKIIQKHYEDNNDYKKLAEIAKNRGHSMEIQKSYYSSMN